MTELAPPEQHSILIVDDEPDFRELAVAILSSANVMVFQAATGEEALALLEQKRVDVALVDYMMPGMTGLELFRELKKRAPETDVIFITGNADVGSAVEAMKEGAYDYLVKPVQFEELENCLSRLFELRRLRQENRRLKDELRQKYRFNNFVTVSGRMQEVLAKMEAALLSDLPFLLIGEPGTGKELCARIIHGHGPRRERPFIPYNCGVLSEPAELDELFGRTPRDSDQRNYVKLGVFRSAFGGTVYLKHVDALSPKIQDELSQVLETKQISPVGSEQKEMVDVRVLVSLSPLRLAKEELKKWKRFFGSRVIELPSLRQRPEDIPELLHYFLQQRLENPPEIESSVIQVLSRYSWPGNVRELELLAEEWAQEPSGQSITIAQIPQAILSEVAATIKSQSPNLKPLREVVREAVLAALIVTDWRIPPAAELLDISEEELKKQIDELKISRPGP